MQQQLTIEASAFAARTVHEGEIMPNHVTTICTVTGTALSVAVFRAAHLTKSDEAELFDFDRIIPRPDSVKASEASSDADHGFYALTGLHPSHFSWSVNPIANMPGAGPMTSVDDYRRFLEATRPEAITKGQAQLTAFRETGFRTWYDWSVEHWGTKWGSYDVEVRDGAADSLVFKFETAWAFPEPIFRRLAAMYPQLVFSVVSYDEGGNFACEGSFNGANDYRRVAATPELYRRVYGRDEDAEESGDGSTA